MTESPSEGGQAPSPAPMSRREARQLREAEEARRVALPEPGARPHRAADPAPDPAGPGADPSAVGPEVPSPPLPARPAPPEMPQRRAARQARARETPQAMERAQVRETPSAAPPQELLRPPQSPQPGPAHVPPRPRNPPTQPQPQPQPAPVQRDAAPAPSASAPSSAPAAPAPRASTPPAPTAAVPVLQPAPDQPAPERPRPDAQPSESPAGFIRSTPKPPPGGVRGFLYRITGGALNLGPSEQDRKAELLEQRIARRLDGNWNTAFLSLKGGIGKTSTTVGVGLTLAELRSEPPCAIDANPDAGDLVERALGEGAYESERRNSVTTLLRNADAVKTRADLLRYLHHAGSLHLLAGEQDPELSDSLTAEDYRRVHALVSHHFTVTLTDCGTGVSRPAMRGILEDADNIVVVAGFAVSGAKRARDTLRWLSAHGYDRLAQEAIVVVTDKDGVSGRVDKPAIEAALAGMCRALITVPHDRSMADGDLVALDRLQPATRQAYREIAAAIVSGYQDHGRRGSGRRGT